MSHRMCYAGKVTKHGKKKEAARLALTCWSGTAIAKAAKDMDQLACKRKYKKYKKKKH